ncbi:MAG: AI-2E family transporter, partial [Planctomycetota bacterium]
MSDSPPKPAPSKPTPARSPGDTAHPREFRRYVWQRRWFQTLLAALVIFLVLSYVLPGILGLLYAVRSVLVPVLIGLALAYIINPVLRFAEVRLKIGRLAGTISVLLLTLVVMAAITPPSVRLIYNQGGELLETVRDSYPRYVDKLLATIEDTDTRAAAGRDPEAAESEAENRTTKENVSENGSGDPSGASAAPAADGSSPTQDAEPGSEETDPDPEQASAAARPDEQADAENESLIDKAVSQVVDVGRNRELLEMGAERLRNLDAAVIAGW